MLEALAEYGEKRQPHAVVEREVELEGVRDDDVLDDTAVEPMYGVLDIVPIVLRGHHHGAVRVDAPRHAVGPQVELAVFDS
ncbi:MAG: hypothetical protein QOI99_12 [Actinomycetota bacterium]|jgi:hypothetical protein|nr:hypothetical protein [Actinomycetota bacterium]